LLPFAVPAPLVAVGLRLAELVPFVPVEEDWLEVTPWFIVDDEFTSVDDWLALTLLSTLWLPLPMFTPGLMFAPAFTSLLDTPTLAFTPTFGFTLSVELLLDGEVDELLVEGAVVPLVEGALLPLEDEVPPIEPALVLPDVPEAFTPPEDVVLPRPPAVPVLPVAPAAPESDPLAPDELAPFVPEAMEPLVPEEALPPADADPPEALESGMQSMCTGLAECSFALPVSLSASLPAFGWLSELQSGLVASALEVVVVLDWLVRGWLVVERDCVVGVFCAEEPELFEVSAICA
jgi:hypothetical protein